jgi:uncharacterized protein
VHTLAAHRTVPNESEEVYFRRVFTWLAIGLGTSSAVAYGVATDARPVNNFLTHHRYALVALILVQLLLVGSLAGLVEHMTVAQAAAIFVAYAALTGVMFASLFLIFTVSSLASTFGVTAGMFAALAVWGYLTNRDLSSWGNLLIMALVGQVLALVVNLLWASSSLYWITTASGIAIFSAFTTYDIQRLKDTAHYDSDGDAPPERREAIVGALSLYLDFVNLFLYLVRLLGRKR